MNDHHFDHKHDPEHSPHDNSGEKTRYWKVFWTGMGILIFQTIGGLLSNGLALLADSAHVAVDVLSAGLSNFVVYLTEKLPSYEKNIRWSGKFIVISLLLFTLQDIAIDAIFRYENPEETIGWMMCLFAIPGGIGNLYMLKVLINAPASEKNDTNIAASLHVLVDFVSSIIVVASSISIWTTGCKIIDPIMSFSLCVILALVSVVLLVAGHDHSSCHNHSH